MVNGVTTGGPRMKIKKHIVGMLQANCYVVWEEDSGRAMVIDPGGNAAKIGRTVAEKNLSLQAIVHTHGHWDHTAASRSLQKKTGAPVLRHPADSRSGLLHRVHTGPDVEDLEHGQEIGVGELRFSIIHTPGHSRGSVCLYGQGVLFTGDLLFQMGVGRTDLKGGSFRELVRSLNERLAEVPDQTAVYPGHGPATTLYEERRLNPFFKLAREIKRQSTGLVGHD